MTSHEFSAKLRARRVAVDWAEQDRTDAMIRQRHLELDQFEADLARLKFLRKLDESDEDVDEWQAGFIESQLKRPGDPLQFTIKERAVIDRMMNEFPRCTDHGVTTKYPQTSPPGRCGYYVREEKHLCLEPATVRKTYGLELCAEHAARAREELARLRYRKHPTPSR